MVKGNWTQEEIEVLKNHYPEKGPKKISVVLSRSYHSVKNKAASLGIKNINRIEEKHKKYIRDYYANVRTKDIAETLGISIYAIYNYAANNGIKKSPEFLASPESGILIKGHTRGINTRFKKGQSPPNKGKKMTPELRKKCEHTFFKKGNLPVNTLRDGAITTRNDKRGVPQKYIRISLGKWQYLSNYNWEKQNGPIPKGYNVVFKDKNTLNCDIENLEMISNAELMQRNTIHQYPKELQQIIRTLGKLNKTIKKHEKQD